MTCVVYIQIADEGDAFEAERFGSMVEARSCAAAWLRDGAEQAYVDVTLMSGTVKRYVVTADEVSSS